MDIAEGGEWDVALEGGAKAEVGMPKAVSH